MIATDFVYDGVHLSAFGFMIVDFDSESSMNAHTTDSQKNFKSVTQMHGKFMPFASATYDESIKAEFSIIKNPETTSSSIITLDERREIKRWLNRDQAHEFMLVDEAYTGIRWEGSFNVEEVYFAGECYGLNLTFYTTRPFALGTTQIETFALSAGDSHSINVQSDDDGYITPTSVKLTCDSAGTLILTNEYDNRTTRIENCTANEVITLADTLQITSTVSTHDLANDFNYVFPRLNSSYSTGNENVIALGSGSIGCTIEITYDPIIKAVMV